MANNCLVKKYRANVDNNSLLKVGELRFAYPSNSNPNYDNSAANNSQRLYLELAVGKTSTLTAISGGFKARNSGGQTDLASPQTGRILNFDCTPGTECSLASKYDIVNITGPLNAAGPGIIINIDGLAYCSSLETVQLRGSGVTGNVNILRGKDLLTFDLTDTNVVGDISAINNIVSTANIRIANSKISGSIEDYKGGHNLDNTYLNLYFTNCDIDGALERYIEYKWSKGKRGNDIYCYFVGTKITMNNVIIDHIITCTFESDKVTCTTGEVTGIYNGSTWAYQGY